MREAIREMLEERQTVVGNLSRPSNVADVLDIGARPLAYAVKPCLECREKDQVHAHLGFCSSTCSDAYVKRALFNARDTLSAIAFTAFAIIDNEGD